MANLKIAKAPEVHERIIEMLRAGSSHPTIARECGVALCTVYRAAKRHSLLRRKDPREIAYLPPEWEIAAATRRIRQLWDDHEYYVRYLVAHSIHSIDEVRVSLGWTPPEFTREMGAGAA